MVKKTARKTKPKILIVEDESIIALDIKTSLESFGYKVVGIAATATEAVDMASSLKPTLIIMDILLRGSADGITAAKQIVQQRTVPIVFLSANSDKGVLERAKTVQPYGYLVKPFRDKDLQTTIEMALNKYQSEQQQLLQIRQAQELTNFLEHKLQDLGDKNHLINIGYSFMYDLTDRILYKNEQPFSLTAKESTLLHILVSNIGRPVSDEKIESFVWNEELPSPNALRTLMWRLRAKLGCDEMIKNQIGVGYKIEKQ